MDFAVSTDSSLTGGGYKLCPSCHNIYPASANFCGRDSAELQTDDRILAGKFILLRKIGEGNMGAVYEAEQPQIGRTVAVKVLKGDPEVMLRFEREVQAAGSINHPNVVTVFESGLTEDGRGYIAMEYLEGESLSHLAETQGPLLPTRAMELWIPAVRAMASAHGKGIVHRDLTQRAALDERPSSVKSGGNFGGAQGRAVTRFVTFIGRHAFSRNRETWESRSQDV